MKAFIVVALLVASVAAQSMDLMDLVNKEKMFKPHHRTLSTVEDLLLKEKLGRHMMDSSVFDTEELSPVFGGRRGVSILTIEELVQIPLFREYMEIPLFRQFWEQYPVVFRHYVESPLFQRFWMLPQFPMYFRNPVFFYKYIVPQVKLIAETVVPTTTTTGDVDFDFGTTSTSRFNPYNTYGYTPRYNTHKWNVPMTMDTMRESTYPTTHFKYLLEKMINHMNMNKMGQKDITETFTDVKMLPNGHIKESTFGKMVNPITGEDKITFGDVKLVDEKIVPVMDFPYGVEGMNKYEKLNKIFGNTHSTQSIKDILLKHIILNKLYGDREIITPSIYKTLFNKEHKQIYPEMYDMIFKNKNVHQYPEFLSTIFGNKVHEIPEVYEALFDTKRTVPSTIFNTLFNKQILSEVPEVEDILFKGNKHVMPTTLETLFGKKVYTPEVYSRLFPEDKSIFSTENEDVFNRYNVDTEPITFNKMNRFAVSPLLTRMLKNKVFTPKMDYKTMQKIQIEKLMEKMIKNKEHHSFETEMFPTMEEKMMNLKHIPLTMTKPTMMEKFLEEKDIKY